MAAEHRIRNARFRADIIRSIRSFFDERGYLEVDTPLLSPFLIPEGAIEVFETRFLHPYRDDHTLYLTPSPELWMKRLLAEGFPHIYQVCKSFRNSEQIGTIHNPEFTMLEWYTLDAGYLESIDCTEELLAAVCPAGAAPAVSPPFRRMRMAEAFRTYAGFELEECTGADGRRRLKQEAARLGLDASADETWEETFNRIFVAGVEPNLPVDTPLILYDYPAAVPTLAEGKRGTPWSERWELYIRGVETANCFTEKIDAAEVDRFFSEETARKENSSVAHRIDEEFRRLFRNGFPRCTGVALGVDRLCMALLDETNIGGVILFPFSDILSR